MKTTENKNSGIVKACGKLYLAGEYSVLAPFQSAILKNIDIFINGKISFSLTGKYEIKSDMYDYSADLEKYDEKYSLIQETVSTMNEYVLLKGKKVLPFKIEITGKMEKDGRKYGIGSSGSVVIVVIRAMCHLYNIDISKDLLFKLASYVLLKRGDNGSMGDLACIVYEKLILYTSFDREEIKKIIDKSSMEEVLKLNWKYEIKEIRTDKKYEFLVGWTKEPAISKDMINKVKSRIDTEYLKKTQFYVLQLKEALETDSRKNIKKNIREINNLLINLHPAIYSKKLKALADSAENFDACGKSSGAGGGDCGIALSFNREDTKKIIEKWKESGIELLYYEKL